MKHITKVALRVCAIAMLFSVFILLCCALVFRSFPLMDGYRLQGVFGYGYLTKGYFDPVIRESILGMQGSKHGYIFGWTNPTPHTNRDFILSTKDGKVWWSNDSDFAKIREKLTLPPLDMNKEVNMAGFRMGKEFVIE